MLKHKVAVTRTIADATTTRTESFPEKMIGAVFDSKYQLLEIIGKGGGAVVYRARRLSGKQMVAIKILNLQGDDRHENLLSIRQEFQLLSGLSHANIVSACDFGVDSDSLAYLSMEYVCGGSLGGIIRTRGPLPIDCFLEIMLQIAEGLSHFHRRDIIHRDLKPENIMLSFCQGKRQVKIIDFGIARALTRSYGGPSNLPASNVVIVGSPYYMSPEQCRGLAVDQRSDIYSFGCLMYEALTGRPPHAGRTVYETFSRHVSSEPLPLIAPQIDARVLEQLEPIIFKSLEKSPSLRYQSAADLLQAIRSIRTAAASLELPRLPSPLLQGMAKVA
jgi:eukaryotic-like serine/threonine-protein kinase